MGRLAGFHYKRVVRRLHDFGFAFDRTCAGSHELWRQTESGRKVIVPHHAKPLAEGTLRAILREAGITPEEFLRK